MQRIRRIALVALAPPREFDSIEDDPEDVWPGYGIRRIQADILASEWGARVEVAVYEARVDEVAAILAQIDAFDPDLLGASAYMWSFPALIDIARHCKRQRPDGLVVFGGPSARISMMQLQPYREAHRYVDALCQGEGEGVVPDILRLGVRGRQDLLQVPGLVVATESGDWLEAPPRPLIGELDRIASPYQMGLMPRDQWGYLEAYRGCPMSCSFCQWGIDGPNNRIFSRDYIAREVRAMEASHVHPGIFHLDAGLNLNMRGFRELAAAAEETGFFQRTLMFTHVYPSHLRREHLDFLASCAFPVIGLGLQAFDEQVLRAHSRPAKIEQFRQVVHDLAQFGPVEVQILMGLPGDTPAGFMQALEFALTLPAALRVFHTLVLPDALLTRGTADFAIRFDPHSLKIESCQGWSAQAIHDTTRTLDELAISTGGARSHLWWSLNSDRTRRLTEPDLT